MKKKFLLLGLVISTLILPIIANPISECTGDFYYSTLEDEFSENEIHEIYKDIESFEETSGMSLESIEVLVFEEKTTALLSLDNDPTLDGGTIRRVQVKKSYVSEATDYAKDSNKGLKYLLDVTYSFVIDGLSSKVKFLSKVASILNVSPSSFLSTYYEGDVLSSREAYTIFTDFYRGYDAVGMERSYFVTEKINMTIFWDLYTESKGKVIRLSEEDEQTKQTRYFSNQTYCFNKAEELRKNGVIYPTNDLY